MRKKYIINPKFQFTLILWFSLLFLVVMLIFGIANWYFFYNLTQDATQAGLTPDHIFFRFIDDQKSTIPRAQVVAFASLQERTS